MKMLRQQQQQAFWCLLVFACACVHAHGSLVNGTATQHQQLSRQLRSGYMSPRVMIEVPVHGSLINATALQHQQRSRQLRSKRVSSSLKNEAIVAQAGRDAPVFNHEALALVAEGSMETSVRHYQRRTLAEVLTSQSILLVSAGVLIGAIIGAGVILMLKRKPAEEATSKDDGPPEAETAPAAESQPTEEREPIDYEKLIRLVCQKAAQQAGPTISKGAALKNTLQNTMTSFPEKAKTMVLNELNGLAASLAHTLEADEALLLLDWNDAVAANFPPLAVLAAGVLSPAMLALAIWNNANQITWILLPTLALSVWATYWDQGVTCDIPGIKECVLFQAVLAALIIVCRCALLSVARSGQVTLNAKMEQMRKRMENTTSSADLFICHAVVLQTALLAEDRLRRSIWNALTCIFTGLWLCIQIWNMIIVLGWTFVPGVIAFHAGAEGHTKGEFCGAWATVLTARISAFLSLLVFFLNLLMVIKGCVDMLITHSASFTRSMLKLAESIDKGMMDLPVAKIIIKAFVLRGATDCAQAQLSVLLQEKADLVRERAEVESRLSTLDSSIKSITATAKVLQKAADEENGAPLEKSIDNLEHGKGFEPAEWHEKGASIAEQAMARAKAVEQATTKELEAMIEKIKDAAAALQESEQYKQAAAAASSAAETAMDYTEKGMEKARDLAETGYEKAKHAAENFDAEEMKAKLNSAYEQASEVAAAGYEQAKSLDTEHMKEQLSQAYQQASEAASAGIEQAKSAAQNMDTEQMKEQLSQAYQQASEAASAGIEHAKSAAQNIDTEHMKEQMAGAYQQASETAAAGIEKAKGAAQNIDSEQMKQQLSEAYQQASETAAAGIEKAKGAAENIDTEKMKQQLSGAYQQASETAAAGLEQAKGSVQNMNTEHETEQLTKADQQSSQGTVPGILAKVKEAAEQGHIPASLEEQLQNAAGQPDPKEFVSQLTDAAKQVQDPSTREAMLTGAERLMQEHREKVREAVHASTAAVNEDIENTKDSPKAPPFLKEGAEQGS